MNLKKFFCFTKAERIGIYCLSAIVVVLIVVKFALSYHQKEMERLRSALICTDSIKAATAERTAVAQQITPYPEQTTEAGKTSSPSNATTRSGTIGKKYATSSSQKNNDSIINEIKTWQAATESYSKGNRQKQKNYGLMIELNTADTTELKKLWGIGSTLSKRIISFRSKLGGFFSTMQVAEVFGIKEETVAEMLPHVTADTSKIKKLPINSLPVNRLKEHPYISYYMAVAIDSIRNSASGRISDYSQIASHRDFKNAHPLLEQYLEFD